jgi:hypothetical protein
MNVTDLMINAGITSDDLSTDKLKESSQFIKSLKEKGLSDDNIINELKEYFKEDVNIPNKIIVGNTHSDTVAEKHNLKLSYRERDRLFKKEYTDLKIKVCLNCFELFALFAVAFFASYKLLTYFISWNSRILPLVISGVISLGLVFVFFKVKKYQLTINRFDREAIYKRISQDLLKNKSKKN